ncbi:MAG TPA: BatA domain-containing protein [Fimbriiglobus sp.]|jgi:hypothetical protein
MFESFLNPWTMAAGGLLVSAPIIIHLINRMRYRRVKWAAMEFLLRAQKRLKRKVILEQFLLLLLRCILVALFGVLLGRYLGCNPMVGQETRETYHVVILDDTPSMSDGWKPASGSPTNAFEEAKRVLVDQIAVAASQAGTPQTFEVVRLSDLNTPRTFGRMNATVMGEMKDYLNGFKPATVHIPLQAGLLKAKQIFGEKTGTDVARVVHVLGDFRTADWAQDGQKIHDVLDGLTQQNVRVHFVDTAFPPRKNESRPPLYNDNVGIVELRPSKLVVARYEPFEVTLKVHNYGTSELKDVNFSIRVNGDELKGGTRVRFATLPPDQDKTEVVTISSLDRVGTADRPLDRFNLISAVMESAEPGGIEADNIRHAVVEVRDRLPILVVDGQPSLRDKKEGDGFYLRTVFTKVMGGFTWVYGTPNDLEKPDLRKYSSIFLLNVPAVTEAGAKGLETYVREGGGVGFFLGPNVKPAEYNKWLYNDGAGVFPVPLPEKPTEPMTDEALMQQRFNFQKKVLRREKAVKDHPALYGLYHDERGQPIKDEDELEKFYRFVVVQQHWPVKRLGKWRDDKSVTELLCMPNESPMAAYDGASQKIANDLPVDEPKYAKFKPLLEKMRSEINVTRNSAKPLFELANLLDRLLSDVRNEGDPDEALFREFWSNPETADLKAQVVRLRDNVKFGDPLYFAKTFGRGRVTLVTTTAGEQWTDWPSSQPGNVSYGPFIKEMATYLASGGADANYVLGDTLDVKLDSAQYKPVVRETFLTHEKDKPGPGGELAPFTDKGEQTLATEKDQYVLKVGPTKAGVSIYTLTRIRPQAGAGESNEVPEYRAFAFNVDTPREGDLRRAAKDDLAQYAPAMSGDNPTVQLHSAADKSWTEQLKNKRRDLSDLTVLFLVLLLLLVAEQALAVRLSYHAVDDQLASAAPSAAAAFQRSSAAQMKAAAEPEPAAVG